MGPELKRAIGMVYLVGAGPGDPGLLTLKGRECIARADVIVYDRLASNRLLEWANPEAELIYVGKASSNHALPQEKINLLLVEKARQGKVVTRLKGGDPYIFGRGGEEAEVLRQHGIPFEVVPGVTSAIAAAAYAGIPLTHREYASSVAFVTGHEDPNKTESSLRWEKLATATDTLVFLMGMENLGGITQKLIEFGRPAKTPVALVRWGTTPDQEVLVGELGSIAEQARRTGFQAPAIIVVGEVVHLRPILNWFETRPLFGKRVLVTRARHQASALSELLRQYGAEPLEFPVIAIVPPENYAPLDQALQQASTYDWIIFTSANGVEMVIQRLLALGLDVRALAGPALVAIGSATAEALQRYGLRVELIPEEFRAEGIIAALSKTGVPGKKILLPRAAEAREILPQTLRAQGAVVDEIFAYRTVAADPPSDEIYQLLEEGRVDAVTFTSSSTVRNFVERLTRRGLVAKEVLNEIVVACIGPVTANTAQELGIKVDLVAKEYTIPGLVEALVEYFQHHTEKGEAKL